MIEDPDAPTALPCNHGTFLLDPGLTRLVQGALDGAAPGDGVRILCPGARRGCLGPAPLTGVLARGRLDGFFERP
ncbi:hypothetical protein [Kitasatospora viridis]|uniref:Uncharacterized protein n=1 Tax=Kitasatospora viridis TaxID=281105 RepID=A0A561ULT7_9ACTN|nr:hypothetical protein [Kitasatospora viridis]TWG00315.1 hypothetical protein FHX73_114190 [Kitasatospora viridis]